MTVVHARAQASNRLAKANRASPGPRVSPRSQAKESEENNGNSKGKLEGSKSANEGAKGSHKGKTSKAGLPGLENSKSETSLGTLESAQTCPFLGTMVGVFMNGTMAGVSMDGTKVGNKSSTLPKAHFHSDLDVSATRSD